MPAEFCLFRYTHRAPTLFFRRNQFLVCSASSPPDRTGHRCPSNRFPLEPSHGCRKVTTPLTVLQSILSFSSESPPLHSGVLKKWTNYVNGWQERYFEIAAGTLQYYKSKQEKSFGCRGSLSLRSVVATVRTPYFPGLSSYLFSHTSSTSATSLSPSAQTSSGTSERRTSAPRRHGSGISSAKG